MDTGRKLNVHKTFRRRPGRLQNVLCTFNLRPVPAGLVYHTFGLALYNIAFDENLSWDTEIFNKLTTNYLRLAT